MAAFVAGKIWQHCVRKVRPPSAYTPRFVCSRAHPTPARNSLATVASVRNKRRHTSYTVIAEHLGSGAYS
jgi:hypothetical protein